MRCSARRAEDMLAGDAEERNGVKLFLQKEMAPGEKGGHPKVLSIHSHKS